MLMSPKHHGKSLIWLKIEYGKLHNDTNNNWQASECCYQECHTDEITCLQKKM